MKRKPRAKRNAYPKKRRPPKEAAVHSERSSTVVPRSPGWLPARAKAQFRDLAKRLTTAGTLRVDDAPALAIYCKACLDVENAEREIEVSGGEIKKGPNEGQVYNPWCAIRDRARKTMLQFGEQFGLTPKSRVKVKAPAVDPGSKPKGDPNQLEMDNLIDGGAAFVKGQRWRNDEKGEGAS